MKTVLKTISAILLLVVSTIGVMMFLVGNHGRLMFRLNMKEDWIIWGIIVTTAAAGFYLLLNRKR